MIELIPVDWVWFMNVDVQFWKTNISFMPPSRSMLLKVPSCSGGGCGGTTDCIMSVPEIPGTTVHSMFPAAAWPASASASAREKKRDSNMMGTSRCNEEMQSLIYNLFFFDIASPRDCTRAADGRKTY
jgi:hypothetical protein